MHLINCVSDIRANIITQYWLSHATWVTGCFAPLSVCPWSFTPGRTQHFLLIQLQPKHHRLDVFNYSSHSVHMSCWIKKQLTYLLTYQGAKRIGDELTRGRNVHKSRLVTQSMRISRLAAYGQWRRSVVKIGGPKLLFSTLLFSFVYPPLPFPSP